jgi:hypothetical protein
MDSKGTVLDKWKLLSRNFSGRRLGKAINTSQENLCPGQNWTQAALEYDSDTMPSLPTCSFCYTTFSIFK